MGLQCCTQTCNQTQQEPDPILKSFVITDFRHGTEEPDFFNEDVTINRVRQFQSPTGTINVYKHDQVFAEPKEELKVPQIKILEEEKTEESPATAKKDEEDDEKTLRMLAEVAERMHNAMLKPTETMNVSLKDGKSRQSISNIPIDLSSFRLERRFALLDQYEELYTVGSGTFGIVKKIKDKKTLTTRALKMINKAQCNPAIDIKEEIEILKYLVLIHKGSMNRIIRMSSVFTSSIKMNRIFT